ncbi:hypothetical protein ATCC90586_008404 [Pythium insidiosum]|nr:hypothetical protein ATCC90586_008404 [Pythium insidiosum]
MARWTRWLVALALLCALVATPATLADAKKARAKARSPAATPAATSSASSAPPPRSPRDDDPVILKTRGLRNEAMQHSDKREYDASIEKLREALTLMHDRVFGAGREAVKAEERPMDASYYAQLLNDYGGVLIRAEEYDEAIDVLEDAISMVEKIYGQSHPSFGLSLRSLADAYFAKKNYDTAIATYKKLRKHMKKGLGAAHEGYIELHLRIADAYKQLGKRAKAVRALKKVLEEQGGEVNGATKGIGEVYMELSTLQLKMGELEAAQRTGETAVAIMRARDGDESEAHAFSLNALAGVRMAQKRVEESYRLLQQAHRIAVRVYGKHHAMVKASKRNLDEVKRRLDATKDEL